MNKLLIAIVGPTATGKTSFALKLAEKLKQNFTSINLISADSRQVFKELPILTGADIPKNFKYLSNKKYSYPFYQNKTGTIKIHGVGIISARDDWSVGQFQEFAQKIIQNSWQNKALAIIVGGTGLYHHHLFNSDWQLKVKPNQQLRTKANNMPAEDLQTWLKKLNPHKWQKMNHSDKNNPRRLIRAIELAMAKPKKASNINIIPADKEFKFNLSLDLATTKQRIKQRIKERWDKGVVQEVKTLLEESEKNKLLTTATGVAEIKSLLKNEISQKTCTEKWLKRELDYAKRQITWWKKRQNIITLKADQPQILKQALSLINTE